MPYDDQIRANSDVDSRADESSEQPRLYEDDLETSDTAVDPIMIEEQGEDDDPTLILGVPPEELKAGLDKRAYSGTTTPDGGGQVPTDADAGVYEGTEDDLYNEQEDAADQASDGVGSESGQDQADA
jgi:hypothetical protein